MLLKQPRFVFYVIGFNQRPVDLEIVAPTGQFQTVITAWPSPARPVPRAMLSLAPMPVKYPSYVLRQRGFKNSCNLRAKVEIDGS